MLLHRRKKNLFADSEGAVISAGERIFEIEPDEVLIVEDEQAILERRQSRTLELLGSPGDLHR